MSGIDHVSSEQRPVCSKCQTPMVRYNVPHTGDKEQAWRLTCSCKHSAVSEVVPSKPRVSDSELAGEIANLERLRLNPTGLSTREAYVLLALYELSNRRAFETTALPKLEFNDHCSCCARNKITTEVFARPAMEPPPPHTTEQDFQHWLSYSGLRDPLKRTATEPDLRAAFYAGADVPPPENGNG
jgi:hypothetical protein